MQKGSNCQKKISGGKYNLLDFLKKAQEKVLNQVNNQTQDNQNDNNVWPQRSPKDHSQKFQRQRMRESGEEKRPLDSAGEYLLVTVAMRTYLDVHFNG